MRLAQHRFRRDAREDLAMTPMIDVVFLLLIFFVCASAGQMQEWVLPATLAGQAIQARQPSERQPFSKPVFIHLSSDDAGRTVIELENRQYRDFEGLKGTLMKLAELASELPVVLDIEPTVPLGDVVTVLDICSAAHFDTINFAIDPSEAAARPIRAK